MKRTSIFILCLTCQTFLVESRVDWISFDGWKGLCFWKGYKPGGNVVSIEHITAPTAQLQGSALANIAGDIETAVSLGSSALEAVNEFTKAKSAFKTMFSSFASIAPKLGPCLGMFGAALGFVTASTEPTPADILAATNKAIAKLTGEVNDRLDQMKGYVDQNVITLEKELIEREYKTMFNLWACCINEATKEAANECQRDSYKYLSAAQPKFALFSGHMNSWTKKPPSKDTVKRLEASLVSFRDYVQLMLMALKALKDVYETDKSSTGRHYYNLYKTELETKSHFFINFAKAAVDQILKMHYGKTGRGDFEATFGCNGRREIREGWFTKAYRSDKTDCSAKLEPSGSTKCTMLQTRIANGKRLPSERYYPIPTDARSSYGAMQANAKYHMNARAIAYAKNAILVISTYWKNQVLDLIPIWEMFKGTSKRELDEIDAQGLVDFKRSNLGEYSSQFKKRLEHAKEAARYPHTS